MFSSVAMKKFMIRVIYAIIIPHLDMMKPRAHIWIMLALLILALGSGFEFTRRIDPLLASPWQFAIFYSLIFFFIFSLTTILGYYFRIIFWRNGIRYEFLRIARRQGVWFGLMVFAILLLKSASIFSVWTGMLLALAFVLVEYYSLAR